MSAQRRHEIWPHHGLAERGTPRERPSEFVAILEFLGRTLDYPNFKDKVDATPDQRRKPYHEVWRVMADSLGAYGKRGRDAPHHDD